LKCDDLYQVNGQIQLLLSLEASLGRHYLTNIMTLEGVFHHRFLIDLASVRGKRHGLLLSLASTILMLMALVALDDFDERLEGLERADMCLVPVRVEVVAADLPA
jgi:hypothetical protein